MRRPLLRSAFALKLPGPEAELVVTALLAPKPCIGCPELNSFAATLLFSRGLSLCVARQGLQGCQLSVIRSGDTINHNHDSRHRHDLPHTQYLVCRCTVPCLVFKGSLLRPSPRCHAERTWLISWAPCYEWYHAKAGLGC